MAECIECGKSLDYRNTMPNGRCSVCHGKHLASRMSPAANTLTMEKNQARDPKTSSFSKNRQRDDQVAAILLTTETAPNLNITNRIDVISAQAAFEINNFKDMFVGFMNPVKGRSNELEKQLDELRVKSTQNLKVKAHEIGANAIVAVDLDLSTVTIGGISMMMMMASGTAVVIETEEGAL